ncbi:MAG: lysophospholipase, partial [Myxococcales bacterium]
ELKLFEQRWRPESEPRAAVIVVHGLKDHGTRYAPLAHALVEAGLSVNAADLRGHGSSEGDRVYVDAFEEYLDDLHAYVEAVRAREPGRPIYLVGHSMGGAIATLYTLSKRSEIAGLVLTGPALKPGKDISPGLIRITKFLGSVTPTLAVFELDLVKFSRDPNAVEAVRKDPLVYQGNGPARTAAKLLGALQEIEGRMEELQIPLLVLHGGEDVITDPDGSRQLHARAKSADKTLHVYDGLYHDIWSEPEKAKIVATVRAWLDERAPNGRVAETQ